MNQRTYSQILDDVARDRTPGDLNLTPQIMTRIQKGRGRIMQPRVSVLTAVLLALVLLVILYFSVPQVAVAIQRWLGYVPGFGLVPDGTLLVLAEPVSVTQEEVALTVEQATLSSEKTLVTYALDGLTPAMLDPKSYCWDSTSVPILRLPNGEELSIPGGYGDLWQLTPEYQVQVTFEPVPVGVTDATLVLACLWGTLPDRVPQDWEIPLHFVPALGSVTVEVVLEVTAPPTLQAAPTLDGLEVKHVVPTAAGYILAGTIAVTPPEGFTVQWTDCDFEDVTVTDADQQTFDVYAPLDFMPYELYTLPDGVFAWACEMQGSSFAWPLTVSVPSVAAYGPDFAPATFTFDAGPDPQPDQMWTLNQDVLLGTKTIHVISARRVRDDFGFDGYEFTFADDPSVDLRLEIEGYQAMGGSGGGGGGGSMAETFVLGRSYLGQVPVGVMTVVLSGHEVIRISGSWQASLEEPAP